VNIDQNNSIYNSNAVKNFWDDYYRNKKFVFSNSDFSKLVKPYLKENSSIIDIGCGDGRDSIYFAKNKLFTEGIDISKKAIEINKQYENKFLKFTVLDLKNINSFNKFYDFAYCRFLFHAINEDIENDLLIWMSNNIKSSIFIETRILDKDILNIKLDHYRRHFQEQDFINKLKSFDFKIIYSKSSKNFSRYKKEYNVSDLKHDPLLLRVVISK
tara:strand:- start:245 stop:886 length:642 start_codon:yes stop_codon:yes gene_type:complete